MSSSAPTPEYGAPFLPVVGSRPARPVEHDDQEHDDVELYDCGHDPSGGDCDYDCPRYARSWAGF
ncbi:hypothetical protein AB0D98_30790 [Streptomyces sp. NPDC047987]|uniref:hypothetical protein n=1 Tax=unclassified Streptomyces TaxID=2593676 RepID=UPI0034137E03